MQPTYGKEKHTTISISSSSLTRIHPSSPQHRPWSPDPNPMLSSTIFLPHFRLNCVNPFSLLPILHTLHKRSMPFPSHIHTFIDPLNNHGPPKPTSIVHIPILTRQRNVLQVTLHIISSLVLVVDGLLESKWMENRFIEGRWLKGECSCIFFYFPRIGEVSSFYLVDI